MIVVDFFVWWYTQGYKDLFSRLFDTIFRYWHYFSINLLIKTLFAPWKRIVTYPGKSIGEKLRAVLDNLISRLVGMCVRLIFISIGIIAITLTIIAGVIIGILWPVVPFLPIVLFAWGLMP